MKQILTFILLTFLCLPSQAQEKIYTVDNIPKVHLQNKLRYVMQSSRYFVAGSL